MPIVGAFLDFTRARFSISGYMRIHVFGFWVPCPCTEFDFGVPVLARLSMFGVLIRARFSIIGMPARALIEMFGDLSTKALVSPTPSTNPL